MWNINKLRNLTLSIALLVLASCATQVTESPAEITRASVPLGDYKKTILVEAELAPTYAGQGANEKANRKINEILARETRTRLDNVEVVSVEEYEAMSFSNMAEGEALVIKPYIKQIKFIGGAARFWAGAMAGSSVVIMDTSFEDAATGKVIGKAGYDRRAGAYSDAFGIGSNRMLEDIAMDVANYISTNR